MPTVATGRFGAAQSQLALCFIASALAGCHDSAPTTTASFSVRPSVVAMHVGDTVRLTLSGVTAQGAPVDNAQATWSVQCCGVAAVSNTGLVSATAPGTVVVTATSGTAAATATVSVTLDAVANIALSAPVNQIEIGSTVQLAAVPRDVAGASVVGFTTTWSSSDPTKASVTSTGFVTGIASGTTTITAAAAGKVASTALAVTKLTADIAIIDAQFTQGVQKSGGTLPIILGGNAAVVNVLLSSTRTILASTKLVLRLLDAGGAHVYSDTVTLDSLSAGIAVYDAPSAQFLVPASVLRAGLEWEVVRDPLGLLPDASIETDRFPRTSPAQLATTTVPPLKIHFVPIALTGGTVGNVSLANVDQYLQGVRSFYPIGEIDVTVGPALTTAANWSGGVFWSKALSDLELARLSDPTLVDAHWVGVVTPPPTSPSNGSDGIGNGDGNGNTVYSNIGPDTRTSVVIGIVPPTYPTAYATVAHELGHNFGRAHAPCGNAPDPDPNFPFSSGTIGMIGHDVYSWAAGLATRAVTISAQSGDVMSYCAPVWASIYTYTGIFAYRGAPPSAFEMQPPVPVLVVRGDVTNGELSLDPVVEINSRPSPSATGSYVVEGISDSGRVLFARSFEPQKLEHVSSRPFAIAVPTSDDIKRSLNMIRIRGPFVHREVSFRAGAVLAPLAKTTSPKIVRLSSRTIRVTCAASSTRGIAIQDVRTGTLLGVGEGTTINTSAASGATLAISCGDGVRTRRYSLNAP